MLCLDDLLTAPINSNGYNPDFGLLGANLATDNTIKLFPRDCQRIVTEVQAAIRSKTGKQVEVMIYGDGAFKDPPREDLGAGRSGGIARLYQRIGRHTLRDQAKVHSR